MSEEKETKKEITLGDAKLYRLLCRIAFALVAWAIPLTITLVKFDLLHKYAGYKIAFLGILIVVLIAWRMKKKIGEWINSWENSNIFKHILIGISKVYPFILLVAVLALCKMEASRGITAVDDLLFCLEWTSACELVSYIVIYPFEMKYDFLVNRMIRKEERKCDYKEAIREMKEEE